MKKSLLFVFSILLVMPFGSFAAFSSEEKYKAVTEATSQPSASIDDAMKEFKKLSKHERKERISRAKKS